MRVYRGIILAAAVALLLPACATKKYTDDQTAAQSDKIQSVENGVEANQARIAELGDDVSAANSAAKAAQQTGDQAMARGNEAMKSVEEAKALATGKLVLEVTVTDDVSAFTVNKWNLSDDAMSALDGLAQKVLGMSRRLYLEIEGHTDSSGTEKWNMELGWRRAETVRHYLNERGVPLYAMSTISYGESKPAADNSTRDGRSQNRRVIVRVLE